jgi:hypothetical protein
MSRDFPKLEMERVLKIDAAEILAAREKSRLIHGTTNIRASGDEVEEVVRRILRRKLPQLYHVGHGHIVDSRGANSSQLDLIIADNSKSAVLFETENGTEYFPYEAVYAIGEIKSTYYRSESPVEAFTQTVKNIQSTLRRSPVFSGRWANRAEREILEYTYGSLNPLFSFMVFVEGAGFSPKDIRDLYSSTPAFELPNVLCFLNQGVVLFKKEGSWANNESWSYYSAHPLLENEVNLTVTSGYSGNWYFTQFGTEENRIGANLGVLYSLISSFLENCVLGSPNMSTYMDQIFTVQGSEQIAEDPNSRLKLVTAEKLP